MPNQDQANQTRPAEPKPAKPEIARVTLDLWPDVGRALGLGRNSTFKAAATGQIPTLRIGKRLLVPRRAFEALLSGAATQAPAA